MSFVVYSGNGQVCAQGSGTVEMLRVLLTDGGGLPIVGQAVTWSLVSGVGYPLQTNTVTDANGIAETQYIGGPIGSVPFESYQNSVVRASTAGESDLDFYETTINFKLGGTADVMPDALVRTPIGIGPKLVGQVNQTLTGYITVEIGFLSGATFTTRLPNIGVQLVATDVAAYTGPTFATALSPVALTNSNGIATLDVTFGPVVGWGQAKLKIGIPSHDRYYLCYWPVYLTARAAALPQIQLFNWSDIGQIGTLMLPGADLAQAANQVRVLDANGIPAPTEAVTWSCLTAGAMAFIDPDAATDANGYAHSDILLGPTPGDFQVQVTAMGESVLVPIRAVNPNVVITPGTTDGGPTGGQPGGSAPLSPATRVTPTAGSTVRGDVIGVVGRRKHRYYPGFEKEVPRSVADGLRRAFDMIYEQSEQRGAVSTYTHGNLTQAVGTSPGLVKGAFVTLPRSGKWTITGRFAVNVIGSGDLNKVISGWLYLKGKVVPCAAVVKSPTDGVSVMASQSWQVLATKGDVVALRISKDATATGTSTIDGTNSTVTAIWQGSE